MTGDKTFEGGGFPAPGARPESTIPCLIVLSGSEKGAIYAIEEGETKLGRLRELVDIVLSGREISRCHATITLSEGRLSVRDLGSTNGVFVNGERVSHFQLKGGDKVALGNDALLQVSFQDHTVRSLMANLYQGATQDELTGVLNRKSFFERLKGQSAGHLALLAKHRRPVRSVLEFCLLRICFFFLEVCSIELH